MLKFAVFLASNAFLAKFPEIRCIGCNGELTNSENSVLALRCEPGIIVQLKFVLNPPVTDQIRVCAEEKSVLSVHPRHPDGFLRSLQHAAHLKNHAHCSENIGQNHKNILTSETLGKNQVICRNSFLFWYYSSIVIRIHNVAIS